MKTIQSLLPEIGLIIDPEYVCYSIMNRGQIIKLYKPTLSKDITCPLCQGVNGFIIQSDMCWSCTNDTCIDINASRTNFGHRLKGHPAYQNISIANCGVPMEFHSASLSDLKFQTEERKIQLKKYAEKNTGILVLAGNGGFGKTYCSCALMNEYIKKGGRETFFYNVPDLKYQWHDLKMSGGDHDLREKLLSKELLVIDDLGLTSPTDAFFDLLYLVINKRHGNSKMGTIITTNLNSVQIQEKLGQPILSRLLSGMVIRFEEGQDGRKEMRF
jgi:DNA replication protein DnaC